MMTDQEKADIRAQVARGERVDCFSRLAAGCPEHIPYAEMGKPYRRIAPPGASEPHKR